MAKYAKKAVGVSRDALRRRQEREEAERAKEIRGTKRISLNDDDAVIKLYGPAARIEGGPLHGAVYYVADLEVRNRADERMGREPHYIRTRRHTKLPWTGETKGEVWEWNLDAYPSPNSARR
jgi:hypothetical protein